MAAKTFEILSKIKAIFYPERFHGWGISQKYFEGWYYKIVNKEENRALAIIPGIAMDENGNRQAFIQVLDGNKQLAFYYKFPFEAFKSASDRFAVEIGNNHFSTNHLQLDLPSLKGELSFINPAPWPSKWYSPGIMGPFSFVPFMECYHGILSMNHGIEGELVYDKEPIDFTNGRGYTEKDWGHSFPEAYCWMQSNHFSETGIAVKSSVAKIPWMGSSFVGFIAGVYLHNQLITFTTYNQTKLIQSLVNQTEVRQVMENRNYRLELFAKRDAATSLAAPILGLMDGKIEESMTSEIHVILTDKRNKQQLLNDTGRNASLEVAGKISEIQVGKN